jgi:hypothetical protein
LIRQSLAHILSSYCWYYYSWLSSLFTFLIALHHSCLKSINAIQSIKDFANIDVLIILQKIESGRKYLHRLSECVRVRSQAGQKSALFLLLLLEIFDRLLAVSCTMTIPVHRLSYPSTVQYPQSHKSAPNDSHLLSSITLGKVASTTSLALSFMLPSPSFLSMRMMTKISFN